MLPCLFFLFTSWISEVVTNETALIPPRLGIDTFGKPYVLVVKRRTGGPGQVTQYYLFLFHKMNGNWCADTLESNAAGAGQTDLTIDKYDRPWVIYETYNEIDSVWFLTVARKDTSGWTKDTVESSTYQQANSFDWISIATDTSGRPHVAYDAHYMELQTAGYYAYLNDTIWCKEVVDSMSLQFNCAIDLDSQNQPHISYFHPAENLWYAKKNDSVWYREEIDHMIQFSWWTTSIRIGPNNLPGIAYMDPWTYQMKYAWYDGSIWYIDTVDSFGSIDTPKALDIDSLGKPYFVYNNNVAYKEGGVWHIEPLPPLNPPLTLYEPGSSRIGRDGEIHVSRLVYNDDWTIREIHYIHGTIVSVEEKLTEPRNLTFNLRILPNILSHTTQLKYSIPEKQRISLELYDITGRRVERIAQGVVEPGTYSYNFDSSKLSQGIYFLILSGEKEKRTQKVLVVR